MAFGQTNVYKTVASGIGPALLTEDIAFLYHSVPAEPSRVARPEAVGLERTNGVWSSVQGTKPTVILPTGRETTGDACLRFGKAGKTSVGYADLCVSIVFVRCTEPDLALWRVGLFHHLLQHPCDDFDLVVV